MRRIFRELQDHKSIWNSITIFVRTDGSTGRFVVSKNVSLLCGSWLRFRPLSSDPFPLRFHQTTTFFHCKNQINRLQPPWRPKEFNGKCVKSGDTLRFQSAGRHQFRDEDDVFPFGQCHLPVVVESDDVGVLKALEHFGLLAEPLPFTFVQLLLLSNQNKIKLFFKKNRLRNKIN